MSEEQSIVMAQQGATQRHNIFAAIDARRDKSRQSQELDERHRNGIELLLRGLSDQAVAAQIGVDRGTVFRWRRKPEFQEELNRQRQALWEQSAGVIQSMINPALDILRDRLSSEDPETALRAANVVLRFATPSRLLPAKRRASPEAMRKEYELLSDAIVEYIDNRLPTPQPSAGRRS